MKNFFITLALLLTVGIGVSHAQTVTDSWAFGFGASYPKFYSVNITSLNTNYGAYLSLQRNFSEHVGLRLKGGYSHLEGQWTDAFFNRITESTNIITGDLDLLYYLVPCEPVSPYLFAGVGGSYKTVTNAQTGVPDNFGAQLNVGVGAEFKIDPSWSFVTEFGYHVTNNSELDGTTIPNVSNEVNGHDTYLVLSAGFNFFFGQGEPSKQCEPCPQGITMEMKAKDMTDYNKIEDMIKKHIPKEVIKEVVIEKPMKAMMMDKWVLIGVNFDFDSAKLKAESYPILYDVAKTLLENPEIKVEIQGYCDYIGSDAYNQQLSEDRAQTVKTYLVSKGIAKNRLATVGYGRRNPVADNKTEEGRAMNRRIEFRIIK